jgi:hypothetical protein
MNQEWQKLLKGKKTEVLLPKGKEKDAGQRQEVKVNLLYILTQLV